MGGRGSGSKMASSSSARGGVNSQLVAESFGGATLEQASRSYIDELKFRAGSHASADEKYSQVQEMADGVDLDYYATEVVRTQAYNHASGEYVSKDSKGKPTGWKLTRENGTMVSGQDRLYDDLGRATQNALMRSLQSQARQWLKDHPQPSKSERKNYKWNGTEYVRK